MSRCWQAAYINKGDGAGTITHTHCIHHGALANPRLTISVPPVRRSAAQLVSSLSSRRNKSIFTTQQHRHTGIPGQSSDSTSFQMLSHIRRTNGCLCGMSDLDAVNDTVRSKYQPYTPLWNPLDWNKQSDIHLLCLLKQNLSRLRLFPLVTRFWW